jgi:DNA repair exonuclease SbcCD ATPase subunit
MKRIDMLDEKRLQELEEWYEVFGEDMEDYSCIEANIIDDARELIAALKASQQELAEAERSVARLLDEKDELIQHLADHNIHECMHNPLQECRSENERLRAQVTIAQSENTAIEEFIAEHGTIRRTYARESR